MTKYKAQFIFLFSVFFLLIVNISSIKAKDITGEFNFPVHGGGITKYKGNYYLYGENRLDDSQAGVDLLKSNDLINWEVKKNVFLNNSIKINGANNFFIERPKIVYNKKNKKFYMWFHLEQKNNNYHSAFVGVASSDKIDGQYVFLDYFRVAPGKLALNFKVKGKDKENKISKRDLIDGQMSRDMNIFLDDNETAYLITTSEENATLIICKLSDGYDKLTNNYIRVQPGNYNEAPILFRRNDKYYIISSGVSGWEPNAAVIYEAKKPLGSWKFKGNFVRDENKRNVETTFFSQGANVFNFNGEYYFLSDKWNSKDIKNSKSIIKRIMWSKDLLPYITSKD